MHNLKLKMARMEQDPPLPAWKLAQKIGITPQRLSMFETGRAVPSATLKHRIAKALGRTVEELFG